MRARWLMVMVAALACAPACVRADEVERFSEHFKTNVFSSHFCFNRSSIAEITQLAAEGKLPVLDRVSHEAVAA